MSPYIGKDVLMSRLRAIRKSASTLPRGSTITFIALSLIFVIAVAVRLLPLRYGFYLSEFDPYLQWRMAEYVVKNGFMAWFSWHDTLSWYPQGMTMMNGNLYGVAFTVAAIYMALHALGVQVTVFQVAVLFPVAGGALTALACYFLGKDLWGRGVGIVAALFMALNPSNLSRTTLGFLRHEALGILLMVLIFVFFLRATQKGKSLRSTAAYSVLAGLMLFYLGATWAAFYYPMDLIVLYVAVLVLIGRYDHQLLFAYSITFGVFLFLAPIGVPRIGFSSLTAMTFLVIPGVALLMIVREIGGQLSSWRARGYAVIIAAIALLGVAYALVHFGIMGLPTGKFLSTLNPFARLDMPITESVAEHKPATWASFFYEFNTLIFLCLFGFYFVARRLKNVDIFLILTALTSFYFAGSLVRLTLVLAPAFCILAAITTVEMAKPAIDILRQAVIFPKRKMIGLPKIGREFGLAIILILLIAIIPAFSKAVSAAYAPATIATSSIPVIPTGDQKYDDWLQALAWLHDSTPSDAVVMAWWDYGYWITALTNRRTLADNGTQNTTQIAMIAQMFLRNETMAIPMMKAYNVGYVVVFVTYAQLPGQSQPGFIGAGEDGKWYWMVRIANQTSYGDQMVTFRQITSGNEVTYTRMIKVGDKVVGNDTISTGQQLSDNTVLGFMMNTGVGLTGTTSNYFDRVFTSSNHFVFVYQVLYPSETNATIGIDRKTAEYGQTVHINGTVTSKDGQPYQSGTATIQESVPAVAGWNPIASVDVANGKYSYDWKLLPGLPPGNHSLRVFWNGVKGKSLPASSDAVSLLVQYHAVKLDTSLSSYNITLGQNVTISSRMSENISNGTITLQYSTDNATWVNIDTLPPKNGTLTYAWRPATSGTIYIKAVYSGSGNIGSVTSNSIKLYVTKPS